MVDFVRGERVFLKNHPEISEKWLQARIAEDPSILGLGDLVLREQERPQTRAGRLDLLLRDLDSKRRYEVELQLGATDESHIIRTIEYWDIERKRYPQYDHCAVIVAEDITARFLNIISLFNGTIPLIAVQMQAMKVGNHLTLVFTKVLDELTRGLVDEDEDAESAPADRSYWLAKGSKETLAMVDGVLELIQVFAPHLQLKYNRFYIGLGRDGVANNFVTFRPRRNHLVIVVKLIPSDETSERLDKAGVEYTTRSTSYHVRLSKEELKKHSEILSSLASEAFEFRNQ